MAWVVKDTSVLKKYKFELESIYDEDERIKAWVYEIPVPFEKWWVEVMETDVDDNDKEIEAIHEVSCHRASAFVEQDDWEYFLPVLAALWADGVLEWQTIR